MTGKINGVPVDAPLWRKAPPEDLRAIIDFLSRASYHYADDRGTEWPLASAKVREAAALVNKHKLDHSAICHLYSDQSQLVGFDQFMDAVLRELRG